MCGWTRRRDHAQTNLQFRRGSINGDTDFAAGTRQAEGQQEHTNRDGQKLRLHLTPSARRNQLPLSRARKNWSRMEVRWCLWCWLAGSAVRSDLRFPQIRGFLFLDQPMECQSTGSCRFHIPCHWGSLSRFGKGGDGGGGKRRHLRLAKTNDLPFWSFLIFECSLDLAGFWMPKMGWWSCFLSICFSKWPLYVFYQSALVSSAWKLTLKLLWLSWLAHSIFPKQKAGPEAKSHVEPSMQRSYVSFGSEPYLGSTKKRVLPQADLSILNNLLVSHNLFGGNGMFFSEFSVIAIQDDISISSLSPAPKDSWHAWSSGTWACRSSSAIGGATCDQWCWRSDPTQKLDWRNRLKPSEKLLQEKPKTFSVKGVLRKFVPHRTKARFESSWFRLESTKSSGRSAMFALWVAGVFASARGRLKDMFGIYGLKKNFLDWLGLDEFLVPKLTTWNSVGGDPWSLRPSLISWPVGMSPKSGGRSAALVFCRFRPWLLTAPRRLKTPRCWTIPRKGRSRCLFLRTAPFLFFKTEVDRFQNQVIQI